MKKILITLALLMVLLAACTAGEEAAPEQPIELAPPAEAVEAEATPTEPAPTTEPEIVPTETVKPTEEPQEEMQVIVEDPIQMDLQGLAESFDWTIQPATPIPTEP